jgi:hypothetical protein
MHSPTSSLPSRLDTPAALADALGHLAKADPVIAGIVGGWPAGFTAERARALGFTPNEGLVELVRAFVAEDLEPTRREREFG